MVVTTALTRHFSDKLQTFGLTSEAVSVPETRPKSSTEMQAEAIMEPDIVVSEDLDIDECGTHPEPGSKLCYHCQTKDQ